MEPLGCPHCYRLFHPKSAILGKKIRCRNCRQIFHIPRELNSVPFAPPAAPLLSVAANPPEAMPCVIDGRDARRCPKCGRVFAMQTEFAGKRIRCRGCRTTFFVTTSARLAHHQKLSHKISQTGNDRSPVSQGLAKPGPDLTRAPQIIQLSSVAEDCGDVLEDLQAYENVATVVKPKRVSSGHLQSNQLAIHLMAVVLGGVAAVVLSSFIVRFRTGQDHFGVIDLFFGK